MKTLLGTILLCLSPLLLAKTGTKVSQDNTCYTCFFAHEHSSPESLISFYSVIKLDALANADSQLTLDRITGKPDCSVSSDYNEDSTDTDPNRRLIANVALGMPPAGCPVNPKGLLNASQDAKNVHRLMESKALSDLAQQRFQPQFGEVEINNNLTPKLGATTMILGESTIRLTPGTRVGTQVERVVRDWMSQNFKWNFESRVRDIDQVLPYHEGAFVRKMLEISPKLIVMPLSGTLVARDPKTQLWFAPDEKGVFRFNVLEDKLEYPTTHSLGDIAWITDTHGISVLVSQAMEVNAKVVIGCGDTDGKAKAAYYLAQHGIDVVMPADRYSYLLLGYKGEGTILGGAPVHVVDGVPVIGHQPIRFSLKEVFVVQTTKEDYPIQYYDAPARYFRRLSATIPIDVVYVNVTGTDQLDRVYSIAKDNDTTVIGVRITTWDEDKSLRAWLKEDPKRRAILFHSALYRFAQGLFADFPNQVTFGDLRPRFE
jgi:hypothetical protein